MTIASPPQAPPDFDLTYSIDDFHAGTSRDSQYIFQRIEDAMLDLATEVRGGRVLDVACGTGKVSMRIAERGCFSVGAEASMEMIGVGRYIQPQSTAMMVRASAASSAQCTRLPAASALAAKASR